MTSCSENPLDTECTCLNPEGKVFDESSQNYLCCDVVNFSSLDSRCEVWRENHPRDLDDYAKLLEVFPLSTSESNESKILYFTNPNKGYYYAQRYVTVGDSRPQNISIEYAIYSKTGNLEESSSNYRGHFRADADKTTLQRKNFQQSSNLTFIGLVLLVCVLIFLIILLMTQARNFSKIIRIIKSR